MVTECTEAQRPRRNNQLGEGASTAQLRNKQDQANVAERVIFPGLDGLGRWLKRHYSPR